MSRESLQNAFRRRKMTRKAAKAIRTLEQAYAFVLRVGICGIFSDANTGLINLWDVTDLPERAEGEKGWGQKVMAIWNWKNELPAIYPDKIFYGKIPPGRAALMSIDYLRAEHYGKWHRPVKDCSPLANRIYQVIRFDPMTTGQLRKEMDMTHRPERAKFDRALQELQITLNIARRNSLEDEKDTWVLFSDQYLELVRSHEA
jgi:hypothetical protein